MSPISLHLGFQIVYGVEKALMVNRVVRCIGTTGLLTLVLVLVSAEVSQQGHLLKGTT